MRRFRLLAVVVLTVTIATSRPGRAADVLWSVPGQAAAGMYLQEWSQFLWGLLASQTGTFLPWEDPVYHDDDGSWTTSFRADDGTEGFMIERADGSISIEIDLPDGTSQTVEVEELPDSPEETVTTSLFHVTSTDGFDLWYTRAYDDAGTGSDPTDDWMQYSGVGDLPNGDSQSFTAIATAGRQEVESRQRDGSTFSMSVPLDPNVALPGTLPDLTQPTYGTYTAPTISVQFTLTATHTFPGRWAVLLTDVEGGVTGILSLNEDFSAVGQLEADGLLAALVCWTRHGDVQVCDLTGQNLQMGPAGAALDFLRYRWQTLTALNAPVLGASSPAPQFWRPSGRLRLPPDHWHRGMRLPSSGDPPIGGRGGPGRR